jgi:hypothetical protein
VISLRTILRGTLTRFIPAVILGTAILYGLARLADSLSVGWLNISIAYALLTIGYTAALAALRYRLRADADVAGRRSVVAGLLVPAAYLGGLVLLAPKGLLALNATAIAIGAVLAVGMFFPWLKSAPVPALTDQEAKHLLEESRSDFGGLGSARATVRPRDRGLA